MHQPTNGLDTDTLAGYEWPLCAAGPATGPHAHRLWAEELQRLVCRPCEDRTRKRLTELPTLFTQLNRTAMLMKGASQGGSPATGTRTAPIPARLEVLNLTSPGGIAARLQAIEDSWRQALGWPTPPPTARRTVYPVWRDESGTRHVGEATHADHVYPYWRTDRPADVVPRCVTFLTNNILWASSSYESVADDIEEIRRLHTECTALTSNEPRTGRIPVGTCPIRLDTGHPCSSPLTASTGSHRVHCTGCGTRWDGMGEWRELRTAQEAVARAAQKDEHAAAAAAA